MISFEELFSRLKEIRFGEFDMIVAIGSGGVILGGMIQSILKIPMDILWLEYRDEKNKIKHRGPKLAMKFRGISNMKILVVDDVSRTGATLKKAREILKGNEVKTFVFNGKADYSMMDSDECVMLPWKQAKSFYN